MRASNIPTREHALELLQGMIRIRHFEEKCAELYSAMKIRGFLHLYVGEEAIAVGVMQALQTEDAVVATYREHGHALARGVSMNALMAEMYGKREGCNRGRGGSMHLFDAATRFYGGNAIVGGRLPLAVGLALADKMQGRNRVTACFCDQETVTEGEFHESLKLAALWQLPVLFLCENNLHAMGAEWSESKTDIYKKAQSHGLAAEVIDGMDVVAVEAAAQNATTALRGRNAPYFLELRSRRFPAHPRFTLELYRAKQEVEYWKRHDPIVTYTAQLQDQGIADANDIGAIEDAVAKEIAMAVDFAEAGTWEPVEHLTRDIYT